MEGDERPWFAVESKSQSTYCQYSSMSMWRLSLPALDAVSRSRRICELAATRSLSPPPGQDGMGRRSDRCTAFAASRRPVNAPHHRARHIHPHTGSATKCAVIDIITCSDSAQGTDTKRRQEADGHGTGGRQGTRWDEMPSCIFRVLSHMRCFQRLQDGACRQM